MHPSRSQNSRNVARIVLTCLCPPPQPASIINGELACGRCFAPMTIVGESTARAYSQLEGERPSGCGPAKYLRTWHRAFDAGHVGATKDGRARLLTPEAYAAFAVVSSRPPPPKPSVVRSVDDDVCAELGLGARRTG